MRAVREILFVVGIASTLVGLTAYDWRAAAIIGGVGLSAAMIWAIHRGDVEQHN